MHGEDELSDLVGFEALVKRRAAHEPMEYITNRVSFYDIELFVDRGVLIPRPETEILVDKSAEIIRKYGIKQIAEIGIGSGAISIALARLFPDLHIVASDISKDALIVAKKNIETFDLQGRIDLRHTSLLDGIDEPIQMIVSNPPYIALGTPLEPNVAEYEPHTALFAEEQGDALLREIIALAADRGIAHVACEMGYDQRERISAFVKQLGVYSVKFYTDLAGLDRGFVLRSV
jgi:release factor glutamine methyltransferase